MKEKCAKNLYDIETSYTSCTIVASRTNEDTDEEQQKGKKSHILLPMLLFYARNSPPGCFSLQ